MAKNWNICAVGTSKASGKGFDLDTLKTDNAADRGDYLRLVDDRVGMAASTVMQHGTTTITRHIDQEVIDVSPKYLHCMESLSSFTLEEAKRWGTK
eukprot:11327263-Ditylum_brightwellii.AAC.1